MKLNQLYKLPSDNDLIYPKIYLVVNGKTGLCFQQVDARAGDLKYHAIGKPFKPKLLSKYELIYDDVNAVLNKREIEYYNRPWYYKLLGL